MHNDKEYCLMTVTQRFKEKYTTFTHYSIQNWCDGRVIHKIIFLYLIYYEAFNKFIFNLFIIFKFSLNTMSDNYFFGYIGVASALVFANLGAAYGSAKAGVGICSMGVLKP